MASSGVADMDAKMETMAYRWMDKEAIQRLGLTHEMYAKANEDILTYLANKYAGRRYAPREVEQRLRKLAGLDKEAAEKCSSRLGLVLAYCLKKSKDGTTGRKTAPWVWTIGLAKQGPEKNKNQDLGII